MPDEDEEKHLISDRVLHIAINVLGCIAAVLLTVVIYLELKC